MTSNFNKIGNLAAKLRSHLQLQQGTPVLKQKKY